jgi:sugar/nucleoside kinase (ribokinase family)
MVRRGIVCGGSWGVDKNKLIDVWPEEEHTAFIIAEEQQCGGSGANASVDLKQLGAPFPVDAIGLVGDDEDGRFLSGVCKTAGVGGAQLHVSPTLRTSHTFVMTARPTGRRTFFHHQGTHALLTPDHFDFARTEAAILHLGLPGELDTMDAPWQGEASGWVAVLKKARAVGLKTNMEFAPIPHGALGPLARACLPYLDYLIINDAEAGEVAGIPTVRHGIADVSACEAAALTIMQQSSAEVVVVHFPLGAVATTRDGAIARKPSVRVPQEAIVGSVGAGDAFAAGMLLGIHEGWPLDQSLALGHATAAASLRSLTTTGAVENWQACLKLADAWGWREAFA